MSNSRFSVLGSTSITDCRSTPALRAAVSMNCRARWCRYPSTRGNPPSDAHFTVFVTQSRSAGGPTRNGSSRYNGVIRIVKHSTGSSAVLKAAFLLWLFDFLIFEQFWWNGEGSKGLAQELPGGKDNIGCQGEEIGEEAGSLCGCLSCGAPRRVEALEERMPGEGEKV